MLWHAPAIDLLSCLHNITLNKQADGFKGFDDAVSHCSSFNNNTTVIWEPCGNFDSMHSPGYHEMTLYLVNSIWADFYCVGLSAAALLVDYMVLLPFYLI